MISFPPPPPGTRDRERPPRCRNCFYRLDGLDTPRCPECGYEFDPRVGSTYTYRAPFVFWVYWLPAVGLAFVSALITLLVFALSGNIGFGATLGVPFAVGAVIGYGSRLPIALAVLAALGVIGAVVFTIIVGHPVALICGLVFAVAALVPAIFGAITGTILRLVLKDSRFSQAEWLPILTLAFVALPLALDQAERRFMPLPASEIISTSRILPASPRIAWDAWVFYEDVTHERPLLLKLGLPTPVSTQGSIRQVGDDRTCLYTRGRLMKRATKVEPGKELAFDVVVQEHVEDHAVKLTRGSFRFEPVDDSQTRVTLTTEYVPLLTPRFVWRPAEELCVHTLHDHVLEGMARRLVCEPTPVAAAGDAR